MAGTLETSTEQSVHHYSERCALYRTTEVFPLLFLKLSTWFFLEFLCHRNRYEEPQRCGRVPQAEPRSEDLGKNAFRSRKWEEAQAGKWWFFRENVGEWWWEEACSRTSKRCEIKGNIRIWWGEEQPKISKMWNLGRMRVWWLRKTGEPKKAWKLDTLKMKEFLCGEVDAFDGSGQESSIMRLTKNS